MEVYIKTESDWYNFVNGTEVIAFKDEPQEFVKKIIVSPIEIVSEEDETIKVVKRY